MKEHELNFSRNEDKTLVKLDDDQKSVALKGIKDLHFSLSELMGRIKSDSLEEGFKNTLLSLSESYLTDILKPLGYDSHLAEEKNKRHVEIRSLNEANRELRKQLGEKVSAEDVREKLKNLSGIIRKWWKKDGLGHTSDISYGEYVGATVKLCCMSFGDFGMLSHSENPVSNKELKKKWIESLTTEKGLLTQGKNDGHDVEIVDNDQNRNILISQIKKRFPSSFITKVTNHYGRESQPQIRDIYFMIGELTDI